jgi:UDP-3-O-acyl-N-acetylglucosamine deacetylase
MLLNRQPLPKGECLNSSLTLVSESRLLLYRENLSRTSEESIRHKVSEVIKSG